MRIGAFLITGICLLTGFVLSVTWTDQTPVDELKPTSVRVSSVAPKKNETRRRTGVYTSGGRYSSGGGGFSSGK